MKIGILTYHRAFNYGAVLQAYALKKKLSNMGYEVTIIDYFPNYHNDMYNFTIKAFFRLLFKFRCKKILRILYLKYSKRYRKFSSFLGTYLNIKNNNEYSKPSDIIDTYDNYIYGSDQIWRYAHAKTYLGFYTGFEDIYFGNFPKGKSKKISYAASGIKDIDENKKKYLQENLKNFHAISVREKSTADKLETISIKAEVVLDPIFLLTPEYWQKEFGLVKTQEKYVLLYNIQHSKNAYKLAHFIAKIIGGRVIEITGDILLFNSNKDILHNAGPVDFLQLVYDSEFIISTSFHGVAFAILFEKQFFVLNMNENANRVTDLLKLISLEERYIGETENIEELYKKEQIDYNQVKEKLNILRRKSIDFLLRNLSDK